MLELLFLVDKLSERSVKHTPTLKEKIATRCRPGLANCSKDIKLIVLLFISVLKRSR